MMMNLLAETVGSGDGLVMSIGAIAALGVAVAAVVKAFKAGVAKGETSQTVTLKKPVPTIQTREEPHWATKPELDEHIQRTDKHFADIWLRFESDRSAARESANNIHKRLDKQSEATAGVQASLNEVKETTRTLLDLALHPEQSRRKPGTGQ
jgi:hypothetical protein